MKIKVCNSFDDIEQSEWDALLQKSSINVPFLRYGFLKLWWQTLGGGEWQVGEPYIMLGYQQENLVAIAPLFLSHRDGKNILTFLGAKEISDYLDLIVPSDYFHDFISAVLHHLLQDIPEKWDRVEFSNVYQSSPLLQFFQNEAMVDGIACHVEKDSPAPCLTLPVSWDAYLESLDKKQRHEIRRKLRRVEQEAQQHRFFFVDDQNDLEKMAPAFLDLMRKDPAKNAFLTTSMATHMQRLLSWSYAEGILKLCFLEINGVLASGFFCFDDQNTIYIYNSGFDSRLQYFSPGWVLLSHLIRWSIENSRAALDFMRGNEAYKYKFGALDALVYSITLTKR